MAERPPVIADIAAALRQRLFPTVTVWNRLEGRPRTDNFDRALAAEIRDPLWLLTRQWQVGEFEGNDAGSPALAKIRTHTTRFTALTMGDGVPQPFRPDLPMEAQVERRPLSMTADGHPIAWDLRLIIGRHWLKLLRANVGDLSDGYRTRYPIDPARPDSRDDAPAAAHVESAQGFAAVAGRMMDGYAFYRHVTSGGDPVDGVAVPAHDQPVVRALAQRLVAWFDALISQPPPAGDAWQPERLEYAFSATAPVGDTVRGFAATEHRGGGLDWYCLDAATDAPAGPITADPQHHLTRSFLPTALTFPGMPNRRWWAFEDGRTNLGQATPGNTALGTLLFLEFGLIYANDWFLLPHAVPAGSMADIEALVVTNVFGERTWIEPTAPKGTGPRQWAMFRLNRTGDDATPADPRLLILPTAPKVQDGPPIEDVSLLRDEMANMVWAVETTVPLPSGHTKPGREAARETLAFHSGFVAGHSSAVTPHAAISYRAMSTVDENWIPFIPVRVVGSSREIQLRRAALPRLIEGDTAAPQRITPRTGLLREGLDRSPKRPYLLHEEEVPRAGVRVTRANRRARWHDGRAVVWLGTTRQVGRGPGASGLVFDYLLDTPP